jgi:hypothetical protein
MDFLYIFLLDGHQFINTDWFAIVSGLSSIIGLLVSFYQIKIKSAKSSIIRKYEWQRSIFFSFTFGVFIFSSIMFFNQDRPNNETFGEIHDLIKGSEYFWEKREYKFNSNIRLLESLELITINKIEITELYTRIYISYKKETAIDTTSPSFYRLSICSPDTTNELRINFFKALKKENNYFKAYLEFPSIAGINHSICIFQTYDFSNTYNYYKLGCISINPVSNGTILWGLICLFIPILMFLVGMSTTKNFIYVNLIRDSRNIRYEMEKDLKDFLSGREYTKLNSADKRRYNLILKQYQKLLDDINS